MEAFFNERLTLICIVFIAMAFWLVLWTPDRAVRVRALAGNIVLYCCARHYSQCTNGCKWVQVNLMLGDNSAMD